MSYGLARANHVYQAGVLTGLDSFTGTTAGTALDGRTAELGGAWATSGVATDFAFTDTGGERISRSSVSEGAPRYAILGSTSYTDQEVGVTVDATAGIPEAWLIARYVDPTHFLLVGLQYGVQRLRVALVNGGTSQIATVPWARKYNAAHQMRVIVYASGQLVASLLDANGANVTEIRSYHAALATGGALASGKPGFADQNSNSAASTRYYDDFYAGTPAPESIVCYANQSIEFRHDTVLREDSTGTYAGPPPGYIGGRFTVPPAGGPDRQARIAVMAKRNDVETMPDDHIADSTTVEVWVTPLYLAVPRP